MSRAQFTPRASSDLDDIFDFIAKSSRSSAANVIEAIETKSYLLADFPEMGAPVEDLAPGLRSFTVGNHVIFYRPSKDGIEVIRVLRGGRAFPSIFSS